MTDRELLEAAARAAGYVIHGFYEDGTPELDVGAVWNPLTDDGDRYRLLKALKMSIDFEANEVIYIVDGNIFEQSFEGDGDDARAVLRAAAEIGRNM